MNDYGFSVEGAGDSWWVSLPTQGDYWDITSGDRYMSPVSHSQAVKDMTAFIAEATEALENLTAKKEWRRDGVIR